MENKSERKMSLSFLLLAISVLLTIFNVAHEAQMYEGMFYPLLHGFESITALISYCVYIILNFVQVFAPVFLIVLLWLNKKQNVKKIAQIVLLVLGVVQCYFVFWKLRTLLPMIIDGGDWISLILTLIYPIILAILYILGFLSLKSNQINNKLENIAKIGCVVYLFFELRSFVVGNPSVIGIIFTISLIVGISYFPSTIIDYDSAKMATGNVGKVVVVIVMVCLIGSAIMNGGSGGSGNTCKYCDREFSDSENLKSIRRTNMCSNCAGNYKDLDKALEDWNK